MENLARRCLLEMAVSQYFVPTVSNLEVEPGVTLQGRLTFFGRIFTLDELYSPMRPLPSIEPEMLRNITFGVSFHPQHEQPHWKGIEVQLVATLPSTINEKRIIVKNESIDDFLKQIFAETKNGEQPTPEALGQLSIIANDFLPKVLDALALI